MVTTLVGPRLTEVAVVSHPDEWYRFDDDDVTKVKTEDILALRGGGDWHMAYYLVYRKLVTDHK